MSASEQVLQLLKTLAGRCGFEAVDIVESPKQIKIMGRVRSGGSTAGIATWLEIIGAIDRKSRSAAWKTDISKKYFDRDNRTFFAWRVILEGEGIHQHLVEITKAAGAVAVQAGEVTEMPLMGANPNRNSVVNGKGAQSAGSAPAIVGGLRGGR